MCYFYVTWWGNICWNVIRHVYQMIETCCVCCGPLVTWNSLKWLSFSPSNKTLAIPSQNSVRHLNIVKLFSQEFKVRGVLKCSTTLKSNQWWRCWQLFRGEVPVAYWKSCLVMIIRSVAIFSLWPEKGERDYFDHRISAKHYMIVLWITIFLKFSKGT